MQTNNLEVDQLKLLNTYGESIFDENAVQPDQPFSISYEVNGFRHNVLVQYIGEAKEVKPGYYVFEGDKYTASKEEIALTPDQLENMSEDELETAFPEDEDLNPNEAIRVIDYFDGFGWNEREAGQTEHATAIGKEIEKVFSK